MNNNLETPDLVGLFDKSSDWKWARTEVCQREGFHPNKLAFSESRATFCLIVPRSTSGDDFALSAAGLQYLHTALNEGRMDDKPVRHGLVVLVDVDPLSRNPHPYNLKIVSRSTAQQISDRIARGIRLIDGNWGPYYWITPDYSGDLVADEWTLRRAQNNARDIQ